MAETRFSKHKHIHTHTHAHTHTQHPKIRYNIYISKAQEEKCKSLLERLLLP